MPSDTAQRGAGGFATDAFASLGAMASASLDGHECPSYGTVWRYTPRHDWMTEGDAALHLSDFERQAAESLRHPERRRQWIAGRLAAKRLLVDAGLLGDVALAQVETISRDSNGKGSPPVVRVDGRWSSLRLSLAHTERGILVACGTERSVSVGVDLVELAGLRSRSLLPWFTERELAAIDLSNADDVAAQWGVKEALYKAVCRDEGFAPRRVEAVREASGWRCSFYGRTLDGCRVTVRPLDGHLAALAVLEDAPRNHASDCLTPPPPAPPSEGGEPDAPLRGFLGEPSSSANTIRH